MFNIKLDEAEVEKAEKSQTSVKSKNDKLHSERKRWRSTAWITKQLQGHSDLIICMDTSGGLLLTGR